jgi:hypothetical protein
MRSRWKDALGAWLVIGVVVVAAVWGWRIYRWRAVMNERTGSVEQYLEEPVVHGPDGKEYNRKQLLDALIAAAVANSQKK